MPRTRTFIAVELSKDIRARLISLQETLARVAPDVKWVEPENLHVTLLFLGEVDDREVVQVCRVAQDGVAAVAPFTMSIESVSCFGNPKRPRTLWVGVGEGTDELVAIHDALEIPLQDLGYRREERRFTPHITLGRVKGERANPELAAELTKRRDWGAGSHPVHEILIMGSELRSDGPLYTVLGRAKLGRGGDSSQSFA
jgi:2'-5' RNA ligase